jgi:hypothetical protein
MRSISLTNAGWPNAPTERVAIAADRIAAKPISLKLVIFETPHAVDPMRVCAGLLIERPGSDS